MAQYGLPDSFGANPYQNPYSYGPNNPVGGGAPATPSPSTPRATTTPEDNFSAPGSMDPSLANPYLGGNYKSIYDQMDPFFHSYMDPSRLDAVHGQALDRSYASTMNRYAAQGMAGSSAAMQGVQSGAQGIDLNFQGQGMQNPMQAVQMQEALLSPQLGDIFQAQGQYGGFQQAYLNYLLGRQQNDASMTAGIISGIGSLAGHGAAAAAMA